MDTRFYFCPNEDCPNYGEVGLDPQIIGVGRSGKHQPQRLKCPVGGRTFSERRGTPLFHLKADEETFYRTIACLAEGNGIRGTARILELDKDTGSVWLEKASQHTEAVSRYLMVHLHFEEVPLAEFWSFVEKRGAVHCVRAAPGGGWGSLGRAFFRAGAQGDPSVCHRKDHPPARR